MTSFEYRCKGCGETVMTCGNESVDHRRPLGPGVCHEHLTADQIVSGGGQCANTVVVCGPLMRVWSFEIGAGVRS